MGLKFQKTLLLAMNMNSSHMKNMKVAPSYFVNLEMFSKVNMSLSFRSFFYKYTDDLHGLHVLYK